MITHLQVKIAVGRILQRKREKNEALKLEQQQPRFPLIAMKADIRKELERPDKEIDPWELDTVLFEMVRSRELVPMMKGFTFPSVVEADSNRVTEYWQKPLTDND